MDRKKELKELYKQMKTEMGIFIIESKLNSKYYLETTQNLKGRMNSVKFQLESGGFRINEKLQEEWKQQGFNSFEFKILETLEYDKDELKTDYSEELEIMKSIWDEKLRGQDRISY